MEPQSRRFSSVDRGALVAAGCSQAWRAEQIPPRCPGMTNSWKERTYMQPEACSWLRQRRRAGRGSDDIVQGWWSSRSARDARKRTRTCTIEFGGAVQTQVTSLTRHGNSFTKPLKPRTHWNVSGSGVVPRSWTLQGTKLEFWRQFGKGVLTEAC